MAETILNTSTGLYPQSSSYHEEYQANAIFL
jgi:hypothetical protein